MTEISCLERKSVLHTSNEIIMFSAQYTVCNSKKSGFVKKQDEKG